VGACLDLVASSKVASSYPFNESLNDGNFVFARYSLKVFVNMGWEELLSLVPIMEPLLVVCSHHAIGDMVVSSAE